MTTGPLASRLLTGLAAAAVVIGFLNFLWFFEESSSTGDAGRGYVTDGHSYFVRAGHATEVSRQAYEWSAFHGASIPLTQPLAIAGGAYLLFTIAFPSMLGTTFHPEDRLRVERIRASGDVIASTRTGGRLGNLRMTRPLIAVEVRPGGVVVGPLWLKQIGIQSAAITGVQPEPSLLGGDAIVIAHDQPGAPRVRLQLREDDPVAIALRSIAERPELGIDDKLIQPVPRSTEPYSGAMKGLIAVGFALSIVFAAVAIPFGRQLGTFGLIWSAGVIGIIVFNAWTYLVRNRDRW